MIDGVPHLQAAAGTRESADAFIRGVKVQAAGVDANDLIYSLESSGDFDAEPGLSRVKTKVLAVNFADDESIETVCRCCSVTSASYAVAVSLCVPSLPARSGTCRWLIRISGQTRHAISSRG
jgi:hypothetical protein